MQQLEKDYTDMSTVAQQMWCYEGTQTSKFIIDKSLTFFIKNIYQ